MTLAKNQQVSFSLNTAHVHSQIQEYLAQHRLDFGYPDNLQSFMAGKLTTLAIAKNLDVTQFAQSLVSQGGELGIELKTPAYYERLLLKSIASFKRLKLLAPQWLQPTNNNKHLDQVPRIPVAQKIPRYRLRVRTAREHNHVAWSFELCQKRRNQIVRAGHYQAVNADAAKLITILRGLALIKSPSQVAVESNSAYIVRGLKKLQEAFCRYGRQPGWLFRVVKNQKKHPAVWRSIAKLLPRLQLEPRLIRLTTVSGEYPFRFPKLCRTP